MAASDPKYATWLEKVKGIHLVDQPKDLPLFGANDSEKKEVLKPLSLLLQKEILIVLRNAFSSLHGRKLHLIKI
jgi:hypothetical protein